jgi:hypothetical protein
VQEDVDMPVILGPVVRKEGGYGFDTWAADEGVSPGFSYRRLEDAYYARNARIGEGMRSGTESISCCTVDEFVAETGRRADVRNLVSYEGDVANGGEAYPARRRA